jgi:hypothetical protein
MVHIAELGETWTGVVGIARTVRIIMIMMMFTYIKITRRRFHKNPSSIQTSQKGISTKKYQ